MKYSIAGPHIGINDCYLGRKDILSNTSWSVGSTSEGPADLLVDRNGDPVHLCGFFTIEPSGFRLDAQGGYDRDRLPVADLGKGHVRAYAEAFGSVQLGPVPSRVEEFGHYLAIIRCLMDGIRPLPIQRGLFAENSGQPNLVVRHRMFKAFQEYGLKDSPINYESKSFEMANWPAAPNCMAFHKSIMATHEPRPVPAWVAGCNDPIEPSNYVSVLRGAVAFVNFTLIHQVVGTECPASRFMGLIDRIVVLEEHDVNDLM
ncbi:hypothetical protein FRC08_018220 [Ceratobasidium sp. 394]|nr:hypothetical protein FRC08_018220 [Ceratobasidium sp. 394]KAG9091350.1 hypothetical protein FS749_016616 [Ceratobasidium sp. UAMH 11750]